jgi:stage II sporulation protein D
VNISSSFLSIYDEFQKIIFTGNEFSFKIENSRFYINNFETNSSKFKIESPDFIFVNKKPYRGTIEILKNKKGKFNVINELNVEEYLYGVMKMEVSPLWSEETLKAQAVASRTYALSNLGKYKESGFDITSGVKDQVYGGILGEDERTNRAVDLTRGEVLTYGGNLARVIYCADAGGYTEDMEDVFGKKIPYLRSVVDYAPDSPYKEWSLKFTEEELRNLFLKKNIYIGKIFKIVPLKFSPTKRVKTLKIIHSEGELEITGEKLRSILGYDKLKSTLFEIVQEEEKGEKHLSIFENPKEIYLISSSGKNLNNSEEIYVVSEKSIDNLRELNVAGIVKFPQTFIFKGKGWGHGVGMSQWGAKYLGEIGYTYKDILFYYYPGVSIEKIY